jgi:hypothetical protein
MTIFRYVNLPCGDSGDWRDPGAPLEATQWSTSLQTFPTCVLMQELTKLRGTLKSLDLINFHVAKDTVDRFESVMGFKLGCHEGVVPPDYSLPRFNSKDLSAGAAGGAKVKQEPAE